MGSALATPFREVGGLSRTVLDQIQIALTAGHSVENVRSLILDLAVRGRLVERDDAAPQVVSHSEVTPFQVPPSWTTATMERLAVKLGAGSTPLGGKKVYKTSGIKFLRSQNVWNDGLRLQDVAFIDPKTHEDMSGTWVEPGDILLNITGASIGRSAVVPDDFDTANVSQHVAIIRLADKSARRFVHLCIISPFFQKRVMDVQVGVSREGLSMKRLREFPIPLPPPGEQKQIVAKVNQLMGLCDELEAKQTNKREVGNLLTKAALAALTSAETPEEFKAAWRRISTNLPILVDTPEAVTALRRALRVLAVTGHLAAQDPNERSVTDLVSALRTDLSKHDVEWHETDQEAICSDAGYVVPTTWAWVRLRNLALFGPSNGFSPKAVEFKTPTKSLTLTATTSGRFDGQHSKYLDVKIAPDSPLWLEDGDLLIQRSNTIDYVGAAAIFRGPSKTFIHPDLMMKVRLSAEVEEEWIHTVLWAEPTRAYFRQRASGTAGSMPKINQSVVGGTPIPLPPRREQRRILERMRRLMAICDELEAGLQKRECSALHLAEALVSSANAVHTSAGRD